MEENINQCNQVNDISVTSLRLNDGNEDTGGNAGFVGPFGWKNYVFADNSGSGKSLKNIEHFIQEDVLPHFAVAQTAASNTSSQTTFFRNEARNIIRQSVGGTESDDEVIFCGSGAISAANKLLHLITHRKSKKLIVFIGPFEHHSNFLPFRGAASKVIEVPINKETGQVDTIFLRSNLEKIRTKWSTRTDQLVIGCFSAGSCVTRAVTDDIEITKILHEFGALAFWDYDAAALHVRINMNQRATQDFGGASKDAIFFSGDKFVGGAQTPGVLVVKKRVIKKTVACARPGHQNVDSLFDSEEEDSPYIVGSIRLGLVFRERNKVGIRNIIEFEQQLCRRMLDDWDKLSEIHILGSKDNNSLPCISFLIEHVESSYFLHHNFVVALLNDLFGIQCEWGNFSEESHVQYLLGIDDKLASLYTSLSNESKLGNILEPGFVSISFNYYSPAVEIEFVIEAVKLVAKHGWKMLPLYKINEETGSFVFKGDFQPTVKSLSLFDEMFTRSGYQNKVGNATTSKLFEPDNVLKEAGHVMSSISERKDLSSLVSMKNYESLLFSSFKKPVNIEKLRWFMLPSESLSIQCNAHQPNNIKSETPFTPFKPKNVQ